MSSLTNAELLTIKAELANDPEGLGYDATQPDRHDAALINAATRTGAGVISSANLLAWAGAGADDGAGVLPRIERLQHAADRSGEFTSLPGSVVGPARTALLLIRRDATEFDTGNGGRLAMLNALVSGGVFTQAEADELTTLGQITINRATELLGRSAGLSTSDIANARRAV